MGVNVKLVKPLDEPIWVRKLKVKDVDIYNIVFMLHTKLTVVLLVMFSLLGLCFLKSSSKLHSTIGLNFIFSICSRYLWKPNLLRCRKQRYQKLCRKQLLDARNIHIKKCDKM